MNTNTLFRNAGFCLRADFHLPTKADKEIPYEGEEYGFVNTHVSKLAE